MRLPLLSILYTFMLLLGLVGTSFSANAQFTESFEVGTSGNFSVPGWVLPAGQADAWSFVANPPFARTGTRVLLALPQGTPLNDFLISPPITVTLGTNEEFSLFAKAGLPNSAENLTIKIATNAGTTPADFTITAVNAVSLTDVYQEIVADLSGYVGQTIRVAIHAQGTATSPATDAIIIDDIVSGPPAAVDCSAIPVITSSQRVTGGSYNLFWTGTPNAFEYDVLVIATGTPVTPTTTRTGFVVGTGATVQIPANATQDVYVRAQCAGGSMSAWSAPIQITYNPCPPTSNVQTTGGPGVEVIVSYDAVPGAASYDIILAPPGSQTPNALNVGDLNTALTTAGFSSNNILPNVPVDIYVRTVCASGEVSDWVGPSTYTYVPCATAPSNLVVSLGPPPVLNWTTAASAISYDVVAVNAGSAVVPNSPASFNTTLTTADISSLPQNQSYDLYVRSVCAAGSTSPLVGPISYTPLVCVQPTNLTVTNLTQADVRVEFTGVSGAASYDIVALPAGSTAPIAATGASYNISTTGVDLTGGLTAGVSYDFYVRTRCANGGLSGWTGPVLYTYQLPCTETVSNLRIENNFQGFAQFAWDSPPANVRYDVWALPTGTAAPTASTLPTLNTASQFYSLSTLTPGVTYDFYVRADCFSTGRKGAIGGPVTYTISLCTAPTGLTVSASTVSTVIINVNPVASANFYGVVALPTGSSAPMSNTPNSFFFGAGLNGLDQTGSLTAGVTYDFYARTYCSNGSTSNWNSTPFVFTYNPAPCVNAPTNVSISYSSGDAVASWTAAAGAVNYTGNLMAPGVLPDPNTYGPYFSQGALTQNLGTLTIGQTYDYYVRAVCASGDTGPFAGPIQFTYNPPCNSIVTGVNVDVTNDLITWSVTGNPNSFNLYVVAPGASVVPGTTPAINVAALNTSVSAVTTTNGTYDLYIEAVCAGGTISPLTGPTTFTACTGSCVQGQCASSNLTPSAAQSAPANPVPDVLSASILPGDYFVISSLEAGRTYNFASNVATDFFTVRESNLSGAVVSSGTGSASLASVSGSDLYVSLFTNEQCGTSSVTPRVVVVNCADCRFDVAPLPSNSCSGVATGTVNGTATGIFIPILDVNEDIVCAIRTSANLGIVNAQVYGHSGPLRVFGQAYANRNITINPAITLLPGETAEVKLYLTDAEVQALIASGAIMNASAIGINKVSNTSCSATYPGGGILIPATGTAYGANAWEYTFTVSDFSEFFASSQSAPLPVELSSFKAFAKTDGNVLEWTTASEVDVDRFEIERTDGRAEFSLMGSVAASSTSSSAREYSYIDKQPMATSYYRLKMLDLDGSYEYSNVVVVEADQFAASTALKISPNPNDGEFRVEFSERLAPSELVVTDALGRVLLRQVVAAGSQQQTFDMGGLAPGTYAIRFLGRTVGSTHRFVVQ